MTQDMSKQQRKQPQRTCIACRETHDKRQLLRIVRQPDGSVAVDPRGKAPGRGAYLCPNAACWEQALAQHKIERALKVRLTDEQQAALAAELLVMAEQET